jgi:colanic acid/amylovoran biosynthesis glycosyltransferase
VTERGLNTHIIFEGWQNADRVRTLYQQADIFALPSFAEGIPVVLMEAMAMEIPCVTTRITGIPELIRDQVDGLLVTPANDEELAVAIGRLMDDPELRRRIGRAARQRVVESFDLRRNTAQLAEIFRAAGV